MDKFWKEALLSCFIGIAVPWLLLMSAEKVFPADHKTQMPVTAPTQAATAPLRTIRVSRQDGTVTEMELESYLIGVVAAEMPASFHPEALQAQAVVSRTYARKRMETKDRHEAADVCCDPLCCQAYITEEEYLDERGTKADLAAISAAVTKTAGTVLTYEGELCEATYFSCSGGRTETALAVWGTEIPYLQAVDSPGEERAETYRTNTYFSAEDFGAALGTDLSGDPTGWLGAVEYTEGGGVAAMTIGGVRYSGVELREKLKLNSTAFVMLPQRQGITVYMRGKGHRVGMSQYGAEAMARSGKSCGEILTYYYQGVVIDKGENME